MSDRVMQERNRFGQGSVLEARVMENRLRMHVEGVGGVSRMTLNLPDRESRYAFADSLIQIACQDLSGRRQWQCLCVDDVYPVPFGDSYDICVHYASAPQADGQGTGLGQLMPGARVAVREPVSYPFHAPLCGRRQLVCIAAGAGVDLFRPLARTIQRERLEWMGDVYILHGPDTGLEHVYLNRPDSDLAHYLERGAFRAFEALMARSLPQSYRLQEASRDERLRLLRALSRSPDTYFYVCGTPSGLQALDARMSDGLDSPGSWLEIKKTLQARGHWYQLQCPPAESEAEWETVT